MKLNASILIYLITLICNWANLQAQELIPSSQIYHRDPFIHVSQQDNCYYLISSASNHPEGRLQAYRSKDLKNWEKLNRVVVPTDIFKDAKDWWAPDVYEWKGNHYIFVTVSGKNEKRGTMIFRSRDGITGHYEPVRKGVFSITPRNQMCLDGALYIDKKGNPWMLYSHEWLECHDGEIWACRLSKDLSRLKGKPIKLFSASEAPWSIATEKRDGYNCHITDAPYIIQDQATGNLIMLWSSFTQLNGKNTYAYGQAISKSGKIEGPWIQDEKPLNQDDGGHTMIFKDLDGKWRVSYHSPNSQKANGQRETLTLGTIHFSNGRIDSITKN